MNESEHVARQKAFYERRAHEHLRMRDDDRYARKLVATLAGALEIGPSHRVLEVGAGFGRFTLPLLSHCGELLALDVSRRSLDELERARDARGIPPERCRTLCRDVCGVAEARPGRFDFVVGFFLLHHLPDPARSVAELAGLLAPGGGLGFVEPNRRNPLFLLQIAWCRDMSWREEKGLLRLGGRSTESAFRSAGLEQVATQTFGFFPPQILNRWERAGRVEERLERIGALRGVLPFRLFSGRRAAGS